MTAVLLRLTKNQRKLINLVTAWFWSIFFSFFTFINLIFFILVFLVRKFFEMKCIWGLRVASNDLHKSEHWNYRERKQTVSVANERNLVFAHFFFFFFELFVHCYVQSVMIRDAQWVVHLALDSGWASFFFVSVVAFSFSLFS